MGSPTIIKPYPVTYGKPGDTFSSIAKKYDTPLKEAILLNPPLISINSKIGREAPSQSLVTKLVSGVETPTGFILVKVYWCTDS